MLSCKEAKLGLADSGLVEPDLSILATEKPTVAQVIESLEIPCDTKTSICNEVKFKRAVAKVSLNFTNTDAQTAHTIYYQIYLDNALVIDRSAGFSISSGSTLSKIELPYQNDPADGNLEFDIFFWADTTDIITLDDYRIKAGFGSETVASAAIKIERDAYQAIYATFASTGVSYSFVLNAFYSGVQLTTGTGNLSITAALPYSELCFTPLTNEICYITGISLV